MTKICSYLVLIIFLGQTQFSHPQRTSSTYLYRVQHWCIIGRGEFELYEWPFLQFRPFLREGNKVRSFEDNFRNRNDSSLRDFYLKQKPTSLSLKFGSIGCKGEWPDGFDSLKPKNHKPLYTVLGRTPSTDGEFLQRAHIQFKSDKPIAGLILQAVHAPFGLGFPFGQFDETSEFECKLCGFMHSAIIGCISRPGGELMHPTVAAFHHKYKHPIYPSKEVGRKAELHWNFKWNDNQCSSAFIVEFWALIVLSFEERIWMVHKFGPYNFETYRGDKYNDNNDKRVVMKPWDQNTPQLGQPGIPTPIMPRCHLRYKPDPLPLLEECADTALNKPTYCNNETIFIKNQLKPLPSKIDCHTTKDYGFLVKSSTTPNGLPASDIAVDKSKEWSKIRFVGSYDVECIQKFNSTIKFKYPYKVCPEWKGKYGCTGSEEEFKRNENRNLPKGSKPRLFPESYCSPCATLAATPPEEHIDDSGKWIKRKPHTILMIFAFFFVLPLSAFIGRFYKETLHTCEYKGWRLWLMIHSSSSVFTLLLCYASYSLVTFPNNKLKWDAHIWTGYAAVFCCAGGFFSGWIRHKQFYMKYILIVGHLACGYSAYGFALTSYATHKKVGKYSSMAAYCSFALSIAAMIAMTFHIYTTDKKLGMKPTRLQFPIITIRFDDVFPPGNRFRLIFLYAYGGALFLVCGAMIFIE